MRDRSPRELGSEHCGVSEGIRSGADCLVSIPGGGKVESLNVAAACGIIVGEYWRQLMLKTRLR